MKARAAFAILLLAASTLAGCAGSGNRTLPPSSALAPFSTSSSFEFVGYWDGWQNDNLSSTPAGVDEIPIAFGYLHGHTISLQEIDSGYVTASDIAALHARGIKVTLSLGGWSPPNSLVFDGDVAGFDQNLSRLLAKLPFDGVDFDMEHGSTADRVKTLATLIETTRSYFNSIGKTDAVITYPAWNTPGDYGDAQILSNSKVASALSWVNVMSYENNDVKKTESDVAAYGAIFDKSKIRMGVDIDDAPVPTNASLKALSGWVRSNGYGGMMAWTVNSITNAQLAAITERVPNGDTQQR